MVGAPAIPAMPDSVRLSGAGGPSATFQAALDRVPVASAGLARAPTATPNPPISAATVLG
jgi:hypothetical protein